MSTADRDRLAGHEAEQFVVDDRRVVAMARALKQTQGIGTLARSLRQLRTTLEIHFSNEEAPDGFFDIIRGVAPAYIAQVEQLRREHILLMEDVDLILDDVRACLAGPVSEIMRQAGTLAERIERHEAKESDLLSEAMSTDIGADG